MCTSSTSRVIIALSTLLAACSNDPIELTETELCASLETYLDEELDITVESDLSETFVLLTMNLRGCEPTPESPCCYRGAIYVPSICAERIPVFDTTTIETRQRYECLAPSVGSLDTCPIECPDFAELTSLQGTLRRLSGGYALSVDGVPYEDP